uniref:LY6/PLAUR domain containing 3 n=1 Tax=Salvator merianae TaxID=96440 RepID=A0A8D0BED2_SALMN
EDAFSQSSRTPTQASTNFCSEGKIKKVKCPASTHVCVETVAAVEWSHGKFLIGEKGCGLGVPGTNDKAVEVHGILAFSQLHQCNSSRCNSKLNMKALALHPTGNESARVPNGVECYSCIGDDCSKDNSTIVKCYDSFKGCFHGNVTMRAGNFSMTRPIKGCVQDEECTRVTKGSPAITLAGSCCSGSLCNVDLSNKTHFSSKIPPPSVVFSQETRVTSTTTMTSAQPLDNVSAPPATSKPAVSVVETTSVSHHDDALEHDHEEHVEIIPTRGRSSVTNVKVEERHNQPAQTPYSPKGDAASLGVSMFLVMLMAGLLL